MTPKVEWSYNKPDEALLWIDDTLVGDVRRVRNGYTYSMIWRATFGHYGCNPEQFFNQSQSVCQDWLEQRATTGKAPAWAV